MKRIANDIKNHTFAKVYLICGEEEYYKTTSLRRLSSAVAGDDTMNRKDLFGADISLEEVRDFTDTMPFFAEKRLLTITDSGLFRLKGEKSAEEAATEDSDKGSDSFSEWIKTLPDTACVIFKEDKIDKRSALYKAVLKTGYVAEINHLDDQAFSDWVLKRIASRNIRISREAFRILLEGLEHDIGSASLEIDKICDCYAEKGTILPEDLSEIMTARVENRVFDLVEQVSLGNRQRALDLYYDLLALKEPPMRILALMGRQFNQLFTVQELSKQSLSRADIAAEMKMTKSADFVVQKLQKQAQKYTPKELKDAISLCVEMEASYKSGNLSDTLAVELLIFKMTGKKG